MLTSIVQNKHWFMLRSNYHSSSCNSVHIPSNFHQDIQLQLITQTKTNWNNTKKKQNKKPTTAQNRDRRLGLVRQDWRRQTGGATAESDDAKSSLSRRAAEEALSHGVMLKHKQQQQHSNWAAEVLSREGMDQNMESMVQLHRPREKESENWRIAIATGKQLDSLSGENWECVFGSVARVKGVVDNFITKFKAHRGNWAVCDARNESTTCVTNR